MGVAALIVILSVMHRLKNELRTQLVSLSGHARVVPRAPDGRIGTDQDIAPSKPDWQNVQRIVASAPGVKGVARYVDIQGLAICNPEMVPLILRGIDSKADASVTDVASSLARGHLTDLTAGSDRVIVGDVIAKRLGLDVGDSLTVLIPAVSAGLATLYPAVRASRTAPAEALRYE